MAPDSSGVTRLFLAVWPPDDVLDQLSEVPQPRDQGVRWVRREQRHITLRFFGPADPDVVAATIARTELHGATARLGPAFDILSERSLVVPVIGLDHLADAVRRSTRLLGTPPDRRFVGHLTVARLRRGARPYRAVGQRFDAAFDVGEIAMVASTLQPDGAEYETLATWPVR
jgi:2'-5' RNA ligase